MSKESENFRKWQINDHFKVNEDLIEYKKGHYLVITYKINTKDKVVVCELRPVYEYELDPYSNSKLADVNNFDLIFFANCYLENRVFKGKARCQNPDVFDEKFGKNHSFNKAMSKLLTAELKYADDTIATISKRLKNVKNKQQKNKDRLNLFNERIEKAYK